jgi:protein TonB
MVAIDAPQFLPRDSRKVVFAIGGSLLLHAVLLAWLPPLVRDIGQALPAILEVRLVSAAPVVPTPPAAQPVRAVKQTPAAPAVVTSATSVATVTPSPLPPAAAPAQTQATDTNPAPPVAPHSEPALIPVTPPDLRAAYLSNPRPPYPFAARRLGLEGRVLLRAEILDDGSCGRIAVSRSSGHDMLDEAALRAVKQWRFVPARRGAQAETAWVEIPVAFRLDGRET